MSIQIKFKCEIDGTEKETTAEAGELLTQCAYRAGVLIQQTCGGTPSCTDCRVKVLEGVDTAFRPPEGPELRLLGNVYFITHERLACQAHVQADSTIFVPKPPVRKEKVLRKPQSQDRFSKPLTEKPPMRGRDYGHQEKEKQKDRQGQSQEKSFQKKQSQKGKKG